MGTSGSAIHQEGFGPGGADCTTLCANIGETPDYSIISEQGGKEDNLCW
jgi:hypothetical protein